MISTDKVYKTVLYILNKEQTGHITPEEFNSFAEQAQREIFNGYFKDQSLHSKQLKHEKEYADKLELLDQKIESFKTSSSLSLSGTAGEFSIPDDLFFLDTVSHVYAYSEGINKTGEITSINRRDYTLMQNSPLIAPSLPYAVFLREGNKILVKPDNVIKITIDYIKEPGVPEWKYSLNSLGIPSHDATNTVDFDLHESEQPFLIYKILVYCGVVLKDQNIIQTAMSASAAEEQKKMI